MRVRLLTAIAGLLLLGALLGSVAAPQDATARLQDASPAAGAEAETEGTPEPEADDTSATMVTLVASYELDESGDFLSIQSLSTNSVGVARPGDDEIGQANFTDPDNDGLPRITLSDSVFDGYPLDPNEPGTVFRWLYLNNEDGARPATLVIQVNCTDSPFYEGYSGTATFISRNSGEDADGVLVIVLNPPADEDE